jgi:hypothetical protein
MIDSGMKPNILEPMHFRSGTKYRQLQNHLFSSAEMKWICRDLISDNDITQASATWEQQPFLLYFRNHGLHPRILCDWIDAYLRGEELVGGKPTIACPLDDIGVRVVTKFINDRPIVDESDSDFETKLGDLIQIETIATSDRRSFTKVGTVLHN